MRLDGDIICQQNEVPIWQAAEGPGSLEDIQSVCSCTALTCDPFHIKAKSRLKRSRRDTLETEEDLQGGLKSEKKCNFGKLHCLSQKLTSTFFEKKSREGS